MRGAGKAHRIACLAAGGDVLNGKPEMSVAMGNGAVLITGATGFIGRHHHPPSLANRTSGNRACASDADLIRQWIDIALSAPARDDEDQPNGGTTGSHSDRATRLSSGLKY